MADRVPENSEGLPPIPARALPSGMFVSPHRTAAAREAFIESAANVAALVPRHFFESDTPFAKAVVELSRAYREWRKTEDGLEVAPGASGIAGTWIRPEGKQTYHFFATGNGDPSDKALCRARLGPNGTMGAGTEPNLCPRCLRWIRFFEQQSAKGAG